MRKIAVSAIMASIAFGCPAMAADMSQFGFNPPPAVDAPAKPAFRGGGDRERALVRERIAQVRRQLDERYDAARMRAAGDVRKLEEIDRHQAKMNEKLDRQAADLEALIDRKTGGYDPVPKF